MEEYHEVNYIFTDEKANDVRLALCAARERSGMSYQSLAQAIGVSESTLMRYFSGQTKAPRFDLLVSIRAALGVSIDELVGFRTRDDSAAENPYIEIIRLYQDQAEVLRHDTRHVLLVSRVALFVLFAIIALVAIVLIYDISHPDRGWVQYAAEFISGSLAARL